MVFSKRRNRDSRFPEYVPVAERKQKAAQKVAKLKKDGKHVSPVIISGRLIAKTFWGKAWCKHFESLGDYTNRLPRGRSYVRNGAVVDLAIAEGVIHAQVQGSYLYKVTISITACSTAQWQKLVKECSGKIDTLIELLQGKFSKHIMEIMVDKDRGLFPLPREIKISCSCPDYASLCKHSAAVLYGIAARLDEKPEDLFTLRQVDYMKLIDSSNMATDLTNQQDANILDDTDLSALFGIEIDDAKLTKKQKAVVKTKTTKKQVTKKTTKPKVKSKKKPQK
jgi:uncharacterized Zn finger protein